MTEITLRIRQVRPGFWQDEAMAMLRPEQRLVYTGLWCVADDAGWLPWKSREIAYHLGLHEKLVRVACDAIRRLPGQARLLLDPCDQHAQLPNLPEHQRYAKSTHRVVRHWEEHQRDCLSFPSDAPLFPLNGPSDGPSMPLPVSEVELSGVGLGRLTSNEYGTDGLLEPAREAIRLHESGVKPLHPEVEAAFRRTLAQHQEPSGREGQASSTSGAAS